MGARDSQWSSKGTDPVSIANKRICLALLKIFRNVSVNVSPNDYDDIGAPFWPLLQEKRELLENTNPYELQMLAWDWPPTFTREGNHATPALPAGKVMVKVLPWPDSLCTLMVPLWP